MVEFEISKTRPVSTQTLGRIVQASNAACTSVPKTHKAFNLLNSKKWLVLIHVISSEEIQSLNNRFRYKDKPTDVLSFPMWQGHWVKAPHNRRDKISLLGEIFICIEIARSQCADFGTTPTEELERLAIHGTLHLLDYDHERGPKDAAIMRRLEKKALLSHRLDRRKSRRSPRRV